jgi:hypothetical protein
MDIVSLVIGLASGAAGGNVAGKVMNSSMGTMGRSLTGIVGGTGLAAVAQMLGLGGVADPTAGASLDIMSIVSSVASGGIGGGILTAILGKVMGK